MTDGAVLYFHGASSERDVGPSDEDVARAGVRLIRHVRPGYEGSEPRSVDGLQEIAAAAIDELAAEVGRVVLMGWSGGGPYALAGASLGRPEVRGVALLGSWAPMEPPDRGLPLGVRLVMRLGRRAPRSVLRASLTVVGLRTPGHVDDVWRVARPWGFTVDDVVARVPVAAWHAGRDPEVPIGPWAGKPGVDLHRLPGDGHHPSSETWRAALTWATTQIA